MALSCLGMLCYHCAFSFLVPTWGLVFFFESPGFIRSAICFLSSSEPPRCPTLKSGFSMLSVSLALFCAAWFLRCWTSNSPTSVSPPSLYLEARRQILAGSFLWSNLVFPPIQRGSTDVKSSRFKRIKFQNKTTQPLECGNLCGQHVSGPVYFGVGSCDGLGGMPGINTQTIQFRFFF